MPRPPSQQPPAEPPYVLDQQIGFLLRQANQRHTAIFAEEIGTEVTPRQWATIARLNEMGPLSQNHLGRLTAMDAATIKGVVYRLVRRGLVETRPDEEDGRRLIVGLTAEGQALFAACLPKARAVTAATLAPRDRDEGRVLIHLLGKSR